MVNMTHLRKYNVYSCHHTVLDPSTIGNPRSSGTKACRPFRIIYQSPCFFVLFLSQMPSFSFLFHLHLRPNSAMNKSKDLNRYFRDSHHKGCTFKISSEEFLYYELKNIFTIVYTVKWRNSKCESLN